MPSSRNVVLCSTPLALSQNTRLMFYYNHHRLSTFSTRMLLKIPVDPSLPPRAADLIRQMNRHPTFLGVLEILPNQFRTLLKETGHDLREEFLLDFGRDNN